MNSYAGERILLNVGCGPRNARNVPAFFNDWRQLRVDIDVAVEPDIVADLTDLSPIADGEVHAVWASHCLEHLYQHEVPRALAEFRRVLHADGFLCLLVPDLQTVGQYAASDRLHETLYDSSAGPITAHDIFFGFGQAIAEGHTAMAHRCGFTPSILQRCFEQVNFGEVMLRRRQRSLELMAIARSTPADSEIERAELLQALQL